MTRVGSLAGVWLVMTGCAAVAPDGAQVQSEPQSLAEEPSSLRGPQLAPPAVYTMSNDGVANEVAEYLRAPDGSLRPLASFETGGAGDPGIVGTSQDSLVFSAKLQRFFAVNAGDSTIAMLAIDAHGALSALSTVPSGGTGPVSLTVHDGTVYVLNQGAPGAAAGTPGAANISGFRVYGSRLVPIAGSTRALSGPSGLVATDIRFTPDGRFLVVAELATNHLDTFRVVDGVAQAGRFQASAGMEPFAFDFTADGFLVVAEIGAPGVSGGSSVSSYRVSDRGALIPITSALPTFQDAACWIVSAGPFAYIANVASSTITGIEVSRTGEVTLLDANGVTAVSSAVPIDLALSPDHHYLYSLAAASHTINVFALGADGRLTPEPDLPGVPDNAIGLVAR